MYNITTKWKDCDDAFILAYGWISLKRQKRIFLYLCMRWQHCSTLFLWVKDMGMYTWKRCIRLKFYRFKIDLHNDSLKVCLEECFLVVVLPTFCLLLKYIECFSSTEYYHIEENLTWSRITKCLVGNGSAVYSTFMKS